MHSRVTRAVMRSIAATAPNEFLIFRPGVNDSYKGPAVFDADSAKSVMAAYARSGVDLMIDNEHDSLDGDARKLRSDAGNAMGWFNLDLRSDGSLWAVNVKWNTEGRTRLANKTQRYVSPAFLTDGDRVVELINVAICAMPATYGAAPLVAASKNSTHPRPVLSVRVPVSTRMRLYTLAARRSTTVSGLILTALSALSDTGAPSVDAVAKLGALLNALGVPADASRAAKLKALGDLLDAPASEIGSEDSPPPSPDGTDPLASGADPAPAKLSTLASLSAADRARAAKLGITTNAQWAQAKAAVHRRHLEKKVTKR